MKKRLLIPISTLLLTGFALSSCSTFKKDLDRKSKEREAEATASETTEATETSEATEATTKTTEETTPPEPSIVTVESNVYDDADAPIEVDWDNYQAQDTKPADSNKFTRYSDEYIDVFTPMDDYGAVFPYRATYSYGSVSDSVFEDEANTVFNSYGLCDSQGRIICDPVFSLAYFVRHGELVLVASGEYPDRKYGLIDKTGSKFTGLIYDEINVSTYGVFARANGEVTMYDDEQNVVMKAPYKFDKESFGYDVEDHYIVIERLPDKDHAMLNMGQGMLYPLVLSTGRFIGTGMAKNFVDPGITVGGKYNEVYLSDLDGDQLSDTYKSAAFVNSYPVFIDDSDNYYALDPQGNVLNKLGKYTEVPFFDEYLNYTVASTEAEGVQIFDKDFNEIGTFDYDSHVSTYDWYRDSYGFVPDVEPYVCVDGALIDGATGEKVMDCSDNVHSVYVCGDVIAAVEHNVGFKIFLNNGTEIDVGSEEKLSFEYDLITKTPYIIVYGKEHTDIYNAKTGTAQQIDAVFGKDYRADILDGVLYFHDEDVTTIHSLESLELLFSYTTTDPIGE